MSSMEQMWPQEWLDEERQARDRLQPEQKRVVDAVDITKGNANLDWSIEEERLLVRSYSINGITVNLAEIINYHSGEKLDEALIQRNLQYLLKMTARMSELDSDFYEGLKRDGMWVLIVPPDICGRAHAKHPTDHRGPMIVLNSEEAISESVVAHELVHVGYMSAYGATESTFSEMMAIGLGADYVDQESDETSVNAVELLKQHYTDCLQWVYIRCRDQGFPLPNNYIELLDTVRKFVDVEDDQTILETVTKYYRELRYNYASAYAEIIREMYGRDELVQVAIRGGAAGTDSEVRARINATEYRVSADLPPEDMAVEPAMQYLRLTIQCSLEDGLDIDSDEAVGVMEEAAFRVLSRLSVKQVDMDNLFGPAFDPEAPEVPSPVRDAIEELPAAQLGALVSRGFGLLEDNRFVEAAQSFREYANRAVREAPVYVQKTLRVFAARLQSRLRRAGIASDQLDEIIGSLFGAKDSPHINGVLRRLPRAVRWAERQSQLGIEAFEFLAEGNYELAIYMMRLYGEGIRDYSPKVWEQKITQFFEGFKIELDLANLLSEDLRKWINEISLDLVNKIPGIVLDQLSGLVEYCRDTGSLPA